MDFCGECKYLNVKEKEQHDKKVNHKCLKYNRILFHRDYHPKIPKLSECDE
ncbi:hypothetical protein [Halocella sp. SP3-1]|uniref:hypothetical protein n=1 Tax=Halocella sp. SP3-1 TaxID=2382161 RepID=UPI0013DF1CB0|nr:hypothetical protein [Halocella sp. SP3-1]